MEMYCVNWKTQYWDVSFSQIDQWIWYDLTENPLSTFGGNRITSKTFYGRAKEIK